MNRFARSRSAAFTIIEIMIAMTIFAMVMTAIYACWSAILRGSHSGLAAAKEAQRSRMATRILEESLVSCQLFEQNIKDYSFEADTSDQFAVLSFVAHLPPSFPRTGRFYGQNVRRLIFNVEDGGDMGNVLVLRQHPILMEIDVDEEENPLVLARNVTLFELEFWDTTTSDWTLEWLNTNQIPKLVRFTLGFTGEGKAASAPEELVTRVVSLPTIAVPVDSQVPVVANQNRRGNPNNPNNPNNGNQGNPRQNNPNNGNPGRGNPRQ